MAITARFGADFSSFYDAVQKANTQLRGFEDGAGKVEKSLNRMVDNFSGRKIIQDATLMAQAIENVGGVTKLTATELQRVGTQAQEAAEKLRSWGQKVPQNIQNVADAARNAEQATGDLASQVRNLAGAFGISLGAAGIVGFAKSLLDTGDELVRVADRTGLTTIEVQKLQYIAGQSGNTIDQLTAAIGQFQKRLTLGDSGAIAAVKQLGLDLDALKTQSPYDQMATLAEAISKVEDPAQKATLQVQLFGRAGIEALPSMIANFKAVGDAAPVMSDKVVRALDRAGDALKTATTQIKVWAAEAYNTAGRAFDRLTASSLEFAAKLMPSITNTQLLKDQAMLLRSHLDDQDQVIRKNAISFTDFEPKVEKATKAVKEHAAAVIGLGEGEKTLEGTLRLQQSALQAHYELLERIIPTTRDWWGLLTQTDGEVRVLASHSIPLATGAVANLGSGVVHLGDQIAGAMKQSGSFLDSFISKLGLMGSVLNGVQGEWADFAKIGINAIEGIAKSLAKGDIFGAIVAGATAAVAVVTRLWGKIRELFGGPSEDELAARDRFATMFDSAQDALNQLAPKLAAAGVNGDEARQMIQALFDATHVSAKAVDDAMAAINNRLNATADAANAATDAINKLGAASANIPSGPTSSGDYGHAVSYGSTGGMVTASGIQHFMNGGRVLPFRGRDTVPAMLTPGEVVLNRAQQQALLSGSGGVIEITLINQTNGVETSRAVTRIQSRDLQMRRKLGAA